MRSVAFVLLMAATAAGCSTPHPSSSPALTLSVDNQTSVAVAVRVNGTVVATVPAGVIGDPLIVTLPELPWNVEALSPSGRVLLTLAVRPGDTTLVSDSNGLTQTGDVARVALVCGRLAVWAGPQVEGPFSPESGDCR